VNVCIRQWRCLASWSIALTLLLVPPSWASIPEDDIREAVDEIFAIVLGNVDFTAQLEAYSGLSSDDSDPTCPVQTSDPELTGEEETLPSYLTQTISFGDGCVGPDGISRSGTLTIALTDIVETAIAETAGTSLTANFAITADNLVSDGVSVANGGASGSFVAVTNADDELQSGNANLTFNNLLLGPDLYSGSLGVAVENLDLNSGTGQLLLDFSNFVSPAISISSGSITIAPGSVDGSQVLIIDIVTGDGPIQLNVTVFQVLDQFGDPLTGLWLISSEAGQFGDWVVELDDVRVDKAVCYSYPVGGTILISDPNDPESPAWEVLFTNACDGTYLASEVTPANDAVNAIMAIIGLLLE
jgi:hypothetical protein